MSTVCIGIESVLAKPGGVSIVQKQVDEEARKFYMHMLTGYRVVLLTEWDEAYANHVQHWLRTVGIVGYDDLLYASPEAADLTDVRFRQVTGLRAARTDVSLFVDGDPLVIAMASQQGINSLLWLRGRPALMRGDLKPRKIRNWDAIVGEQEDQQTFAESREP